MESPAHQPATAAGASSRRRRRLGAGSLLSAAVAFVLAPVLVVGSAQGASADIVASTCTLGAVGGGSAAFVAAPTSLLGTATAAEGTVVGAGTAGAGVAVGGTAAAGAVTIAGIAAFCGTYLGLDWIYNRNGTAAVDGSMGGPGGGTAWRWTSTPTCSSPCTVGAINNLTWSVTNNTGLATGAAFSFVSYYSDGTSEETTGRAPCAAAGAVCSFSRALFQTSVGKDVVYALFRTHDGTAPYTYHTWMTWTRPAAQRVSIVQTCQSPSATANRTWSSSVFDSAATTVPELNVAPCTAVLPNSHLTQLLMYTHPSVCAFGGLPAPECATLLWKWTALPTAVTGNPAYDECTKNAGSTPCQVVLYKGETPCTSSSVSCTDWKTSPGETPYTCKWGPYSVPLSDCNFWPNNPTPNPTPSTTTSPNPNPTSSPTVGTPVFPTEGPNGIPTAGPVPQPGDPDPTGEGCMGAAWSWNPVNWVYIPIKCAFQWGFKPSQATLARVDALPGRFTDKAPFSFFTAATGTVAGLQGVQSQCWVLGTTMPSPIGHVTLLDSCTPDAIVGVLQNFRALMSIALYVAVISPLLWWAWKQYAPGATGVA